MGSTGIGILALFGADVLAQQSGTQLVFAAIHLAGLALAAVGLALTTRRFFGGHVRLPVLVTAIAVTFA